MEIGDCQRKTNFWLHIEDFFKNFVSASFYEAGMSGQLGRQKLQIEKMKLKTSIYALSRTRML